MGDKAESKIAMKKAGVPTVPGVEGLESETDFKNAAKEIGYPVLIKASAGGGGKGMRVVDGRSRTGGGDPSGAKREALNSFGDERLLIEKYIPNAHHIEFQVFGDKHGHLVHLFERECSVQRRHQKIIEETPSPLLTPALRSQMGEAAVRAATGCELLQRGNGRIHLQSHDSSRFYFLEMNTRLQVEHPVTELTTGLDLVQWQIRVAAGETFPVFTGTTHPARTRHRVPRLRRRPRQWIFTQHRQTPAISSSRADPASASTSGFRAGDEVTHFYDPLLAKLIVHGEFRDIGDSKNASRVARIHCAWCGHEH